MLLHYSFPAFVSTEKGGSGTVTADAHQRQTLARNLSVACSRTQPRTETSLQSLAHLFGHRRVNFSSVIFVVSEALIDLRLGQIGKTAQHVLNGRTIGDQADD